MTAPQAYPLSKIEEQRLGTCDPRLQTLVLKVIQRWNICIILGHRTKEDQDKAVAAGNSQTPWPKSKHNSKPSKAIDMIPVEVNANGKEVIDWNDRERMSMFAGYVLALADQLGYPVRWGGDWDQDTHVKDNSFDDLVHFELTD